MLASPGTPWMFESVRTPLKGDLPPYRWWGDFRASAKVTWQPTHLSFHSCSACCADQVNLGVTLLPIHSSTSMKMSYRIFTLWFKLDK